MTVNLTRMAYGYIDCADWADCGPDHETEGHDWSDELVAQMEADCAAFVERCGGALLDALAELAPDYSDERLGHDFWLTRNGHGAGFWDRGELEIPHSADGRYTLGYSLTHIAEGFGSVDLYVGDDGLVYAA